MDYETFLAAVTADEERARNAPPKEPCPVSETGTADEMIACGCADCMDLALGRHLDEHPIKVLRITRRA
jgi:hypothetical protein